MVARPHPSLLPREKERVLRDSIFSADRKANPAAGLAQDAAHVAPSPWGEGRVEGGCDSNILEEETISILVSHRRIVCRNGKGAVLEIECSISDKFDAEFCILICQFGLSSVGYFPFSMP